MLFELDVSNMVFLILFIGLYILHIVTWIAIKKGIIKRQSELRSNIIHLAASTEHIRGKIEDLESRLVKNLEGILLTQNMEQSRKLIENVSKSFESLQRNTLERLKNISLTLTKLDDKIDNLISLYRAELYGYNYSSKSSVDEKLVNELILRINKIENDLNDLSSTVKRVLETDTFNKDIKATAEKLRELKREVANIGNDIDNLNTQVMKIKNNTSLLSNIIVKLTEIGKKDLFARLYEVAKAYKNLYLKIKERTDSGVLYGKMYEDFLKEILSELYELKNILTKNTISPTYYFSYSLKLEHIRKTISMISSNVDNPLIMRIHRKILEEGSIDWPEIEIEEVDRLINDLEQYRTL